MKFAYGSRGAAPDTITRTSIFLPLASPSADLLLFLKGPYSQPHFRIPAWPTTASEIGITAGLGHEQGHHDHPGGRGPGGSDCLLNGLARDLATFQLLNSLLSLRQLFTFKGYLKETWAIGEGHEKDGPGIHLVCIAEMAFRGR